MVRSLELTHRGDRRDMPVNEHRDAVANTLQRVEIVGDDEDAQREPVRQGLARVRPTDEPEDLAAVKREVELVMDDLVSDFGSKA